MGRVGLQAKAGGPKELELLKGITGAFQPGVLTALMGASGAGKTTFMDVLAGRKNSMFPPAVTELMSFLGRRSLHMRCTVDLHPMALVYQQILILLAVLGERRRAGACEIHCRACLGSGSLTAAFARRRADCGGDLHQRLRAGTEDVGASERLRGAERHPLPAGHRRGGALVLCAPAPHPRHLQQGHVGLHL